MAVILYTSLKVEFDSHRAKRFSFLQNVHTGSKVLPAYYLQSLMLLTFPSSCKPAAFQTKEFCL